MERYISGAPSSFSGSGGGIVYTPGNDLELSGTTFSLKDTIDVKDITAVDISGLGLYNLSGNGILINNSGFVGINLSGASPTHHLDVSGNVRITGDLTVSGDNISGGTIYASNQFVGDLSGDNISGNTIYASTQFVGDLSGDNISGNTIYASTQFVGDLSGDNISGVNITATDISSNYIYGTNISGVNISGNHIYGTNISGVNISGNHIYGTNISGVNSSGNHIYGTNISGVNISGNHIYGTNISGVNISGNHIYGTNISGVNISGNHIYGTNISGVNISGNHIYGTNISGVNISGNHIYGTNISGLNISNHDGHGLSEENFTTTLKDKLTGIAESVFKTGTAAYVGFRPKNEADQVFHIGGSAGGTNYRKVILSVANSTSSNDTAIYFVVTTDANTQTWMTPHGHTSDSRIKLNQTEYPIEDSMNIVRSIKVKKYYNTELKREVKGFIAQEVEQILPEAVGTHDLSEFGKFSDLKMLDYRRLQVHSFGAIHYLEQKILALEQRILELENKI